MTARLLVRLLGPLQATLDGEPVGNLGTDKTRALLAYLAVEAEHPHRREKLAGLLWPDQTESSARTNLRSALARLRRAIGEGSARRGSRNGPPFLCISHKTIQWNPESDAWVDVAALTSQLAGPGIVQAGLSQLEDAVALYRGAFLDGFSLPDSPLFEEWVTFEREYLHRLVMEALAQLAAAYEGEGDVDRALRHAWRQLELDPTWESAHRQAMRLLARAGRLTAALAQYETCRRRLAEELNVKPSPQTVQLSERIRRGELDPGRSPGGQRAPPDFRVALPAFLGGGEAASMEPHVFVARERELARLGGFLDNALAGRNRLVFVTGEAGSGKTALLAEFARRAMEAHPDLLVTNTICNAYSGGGEPYSPFHPSAT